ncbi:MAG: hypothetical protein WGN25_13490 [Candidatus Electrothrix sp. GW3-4]|uniref:hypothetical protein n=1 Tax=Candidatus Electrothrix sp. GW3-4 TaxID=3126740 RepID=UPI0030CB21C6
MRTFAVTAVLFLAVLSFHVGNVFADMTIRCPLNQARRTITDNLPNDWWTTPMVNRLSKTEVSQIGGRSALLCVYGSSGSIQRYAPEGHTCRATNRGFRCRPRHPGPGPGPGPRPETFSTGQLDVQQTYTFDLDRGRISDGNNIDIWFQAETRDRLYLVPRNGARIAVGDRSNRGYAGCSRARFSNDRVSLRDIPVGSYVCARTNEGRISQFRVNNISNGRSKILSLGYTTWK